MPEAERRKRKGDRGAAEPPALTVCLQLPRLAAAAARLVDGLDNEDVLGAALQTVDRVVVLLDVGHDHPAIGRVTQTCEAKQTLLLRERTNKLARATCIYRYVFLSCGPNGKAREGDYIAASGQ